MSLKYSDIEKTYDYFYDRLREIQGGYFDGTHTFYAETREALASEVEEQISRADLPETPDETLGESGEIIGWIYECEANFLIAVRSDATKKQLKIAIKECVNA